MLLVKVDATIELTLLQTYGVAAFPTVLLFAPGRRQPQENHDRTVASVLRDIRRLRQPLVAHIADFDCIGWNGMGRVGMGWDETGWDGTVLDGTVLDGTVWGGMGWDGVGWDGIGRCGPSGVPPCGRSPLWAFPLRAFPPAGVSSLRAFPLSGVPPCGRSPLFFVISYRYSVYSFSA